MGGLLAIVLVGIYFVIARKCTRRAKQMWAKGLVILLFILVPTTDAVYGRIRLKQLCNAEGGLRIYKTIQSVDGFYQGRTVPDDSWLTKYGYKFVEGNSLGGAPMRKVLDAEGKVVIENDVALISRYALGYDNGNETATFRRVVIFSFDRTTNERLAVFTNLSFRGGWTERLIAGIYAGTPNAGSCHPQGWNDAATITATASLKPR